MPQKTPQTNSDLKKATYLDADLPHGVSVPQGGGARRLVDGVEVDGDAEGHADFVGAGVAPADGPRRLVHLVGHALSGQGLG